ncbi:MAG: UPF0182 family protein [Desulfobacteraceae bacterium]
MDRFPGSQGLGPQQPQISLEDMDFTKLSRFARWGLLALLVILAWMAISWFRGFYTDWLWYSSLGYEAVLLKATAARVILFAGGVALFLAIAGGNLYAARRYTGGLSPRTGSRLPPEIYDSAHKLLTLVALGVLILAALVLAAQPASQWENVLKFLNAVAFDAVDPIFENDFSFYVFTLPVLTLIRSWLLGAVVVTMLVVAAYYYLVFALRGDSFGLRGRIKTHLVVLGAFLFVLIAVGHWLSRYDLLYSPTGAVFGIGYTDDHVTLPARTFMTVVALAAAVMVAASLFYTRNRMILWAVAGWVALNLISAHLLPAAVQRLHVEPSELARERTYLANNIEFTREAYGLTKLKSERHPARGEVDREIVDQNKGTINNVRLWDEGPLLQSYNQIQFFRLYYDFLAVHTDRYNVDGELRQVMLATRELSAEKLPSEAQRWVNRHLQFTHGYGVAMSPVTEVETGGRPSFFIRDVPPIGKIPVERPDIYYGLKSLDYVIVRSDMKEFNYPGPGGPVYVHYQGEGGVKLDSFLRRLLYAWQFKDLNILISGEINRESLIQYRRTVEERVATLTPFLIRDREAYSVVADGRLFWIQDAYTFTNRYPYSTPWHRSFNYLRNSVKAVVDAYNGTVDYYVADPDDPIIRTYQAVFPDLFKPMDQMPEYLREHMRYPLDLFTVQSQMLLQYHMEDPVVFYNKEDQWSIPMQNSFGQSEELKPYYIVARLPDEEKEEFLLIQPFTPQNRHNLVGWMAARSDGENYGELVLFKFPTGRHVDGPNQVEARIDNDAIISEQFTLWGQVGSEVSRGILLVIPIGDALLYAEPVFLKPETLDFPELRRIILADSRQVVMHKTMDDSIDALVGKLPAVAPAAETVGAEEARPSGPAAPPDKLDKVREGLKEVIEKLQGLVDEL